MKKHLLFAIIFISATLFHLYKLNFSDIWIDESFTKALVGHSFSEMLGLIRNDFHPPLYFYGVKVFVSLFGLTAYTLRLFSVLGVLATLVLVYTAGQRVFGKPGALYFCTLLLALPMLVSHSHDARMYTWAAFSVTGIYLYALLYMLSGTRRDLYLLLLFTLLAAYTHYYGLLAGFMANGFVFVHQVVKRKSWRSHLVGLVIVVLLYLPWFFVLLRHTGKAQENFWVPPVSWHTILSCFADPFARKFWLIPASYIMIVMVYSLSLFAIILSFFRPKDSQPLFLGLSLFIFGGTMLIAIIISLFSQPILYSRYIMTIVTLLMVPPVIFFIRFRQKVVKGILLAILLALGIFISIGASGFSFGPYAQSIQYIRQKYPQVRKIVHVIEVSAGPLLEYSRNTPLEHYWIDNDNTILYTNLEVFDDLHRETAPADFLSPDEVYGLISFENLAFNTENQDLFLAQSQLIRVDTIWDTKVKNGSDLLLYLLRYQGPEIRDQNHPVN